MSRTFKSKEELLNDKKARILKRTKSDRDQKSSERKEISISERNAVASITQPAIQLAEDEAIAEQNAMTAGDYDEQITQALQERKDEVIFTENGEPVHPTKKIFLIGVESILEGKPSLVFLELLLKIAEMPEGRDVMNAIFKEEFPRKIRGNTLHKVKKDAAIVESFLAHLRKFFSDSKMSDPTIEAGIQEFKRHKTLDEQKATDRALKNQGSLITIAVAYFASRKKHTGKDKM